MLAVLFGSIVQSGASAELILHATFDAADIDGVTVMDKSGKGNHGEIIGEDIELTSGIAKEALLFPFSDLDYVDFGNDETFDPVDNAFSVSVWFDADPVTPAPNKSQFVVSKGNRSSGSLGWSIWMEEGLVFARGHQVDPETGEAGARPFRLGMSSPAESGTQHVVLVIDREELLFSGYINGELMSIVGGGGSQTNEILEDSEIYSEEILRVGVRSSTGAPLDGWVDDLQIYQGQALTDAEVTFLFENPGVTLGSLLGDYNGNGLLDAEDLDLNASVGIASQDLSYDLNEDGVVNSTDRKIWVNDLKNTWVGDSDLNGVFDSGDLVAVFSSAKYETGLTATWGQGDWNGDQKFDSGDLVEAFSNAGYEAGERPGGPNPAAAVPEPSTLVLLLMGGLLAIRRVRR